MFHFLSDVDDLPVAVELSSGSQTQYEIGYRIGYKNGEDVYLNNHLKFIVKYYEVK